MSNRNTKKGSGIEFALLNSKRDNGSEEYWLFEWLTFFILFVFCNEPTKKIMAYIGLHLDLPSSPHTSQYAFIWTTR